MLVGICFNCQALELNHQPLTNLCVQMFKYQQYRDQDDTFIGGEAVPVGAAARVTVPNNRDNNYNSSSLIRD